MFDSHTKKNDEALFLDHMDSIIDEFFSYAKRLAESSEPKNSPALRIVKDLTGDKVPANVGEAA